MQEFWGEIRWNDERLSQLREVHKPWEYKYLHHMGRDDKMRALDLLKRSRQARDS